MATDLTADPGDDELAAAIGQYVLGDISLAKAAERVEMSRWEFEALLEDVGFTGLYGPRDGEQLSDEIDAAADIE